MTDRNSFHTQLLERGDQVVALRRRRLRISVLKGPDKKRTLELDSNRISIGSHDSCDVTLTDPTVSRQHCEIELVAGGYALRDLDSTNGTFVGDYRVGEVIVSGYCKVKVGDTVLRIAPLVNTVDIEVPGETQFGLLRGRSIAMRRVFEVLATAAPLESTVLITGESGTGKELAARALHDASARAGGPFMVVDCGALAAGLVESELYGHARGAFTGAVCARAGAFEAASGGTLFLDEIGELPLALQSRLLGVLERRQVQPLGTSETRQIDVRVLCATNRDLRREVNRGGFREDLYFRIAVLTVEMPPLRKRPEDVALHVEDFMAENELELDAKTIAGLCHQPWLGNVRELNNTLERAAALGSVADPSEPESRGNVDAQVPFKVGKAAVIEEYERDYVSELMHEHDNNITRAARAADIDRVYLLRILDKYGMRPKR